MRQKSLKKKAGALLLSASLLTMIFPKLNNVVYAADPPGITEFATAEQLKTFNTASSDRSAQVYFGENSRKWWIAGNQKEDQNEVLVLFAVSPLTDDAVFNSDTADKTDASLWKDCKYEGAVPSSVSASHYGASDIRNWLNTSAKAYFNVQENNLIKDTTIYTRDSKNNSIYSTTDKLYPAYADPRTGIVTVGKNSSTDLSGGLEICRSYQVQSDFWLRTPADQTPQPSVCISSPQSWYTSAAVDWKEAVVPAFAMDLSDILFASTAPAAAGEGALVSQDAFTLRYISNGLGTAKISFNKMKINISDVPDGTYLVVQNSEAAYAKAVSGTKAVSAAEMQVTSFENCKVWLESTANRITGAVAASEKTGYDVMINSGETLTITSQNEIQTEVSGEIAPVTVKVRDGYYLPENYLADLQGLNGLTVKETEDGFTISGTPDDDVSITLPGATVYLDGRTVIKEPADLTAVYGQKLSEIDAGRLAGWTWVKGDTRLSVGNQKYPARFDTSGLEKEYDFTNVSGYNQQGHYVERTLAVAVSKAGSSVAITTKSLDKEYDGKAAGSPKYDKKGSTKEAKVKWYRKDEAGWKELNAVPVEAGSYKVSVSIDADNNYNGAFDELEFTISRAANAWTSALTVSDRTYGEKAEAPAAASKYGKVIFTYSDKEYGTYTETVPRDAGTWCVKAAVAENNNYTGLEAVKTFKVKKAVPVFEIPADLTMEQGKALSTVRLPDGFEWKDRTQTADKPGMQMFTAVYTPADKNNYQIVETQISVNVAAKETAAGNTVHNNTAEKNDAQTGVSTGILAGCVLLVISAAAVSGILLRRRKHK